jgi:hypothetical protein
MNCITGQMTASVNPDSINGKVHFYGEGWGMNSHYFSNLADTLNGTNVYTSWKPALESKVTEIAPFRLKLENDFNNTNYEKGQTVTIHDHVGVFVNRSCNITLENINMHYMHGLGIISQFSENLIYKKVNIVPPRGRTIAAFADGMHFSGCKDR